MGLMAKARASPPMIRHMQAYYISTFFAPKSVAPAPLLRF
jgi:hypothetical protein